MNARRGATVDERRRRLLGDALRVACTGAIAALGLTLHARQTQALPATALRPPGALPEETFAGACIRCGLCVRDCPFGTLRLAELGEPVTLGTPYFVAREIPCEMCEEIPCVRHCPTGALDRDMARIDDARIGLAVLLDQEQCIAFQGLRCEVCFNVCPLQGEAITLEYRHNPRSAVHALFIPIVHSDACTGCGKCERACVLDQAAIRVLPLALAKGRRQAHYRLGWDEKARAGESLVPPDPAHRYNLPEGMRYDHGGEGLIGEPGEPPFGDSPLETLEQRRSL